jgi:mono/diheme cytochrome c family protein
MRKRRRGVPGATQQGNGGRTGAYLRMALPVAAVVCGVWWASAMPTRSASGPDARRSAREGVYTKAQATRGERVFAANCAVCHQPEQFVGPAFMRGWEGQPLFALFDTIRETMPQDNPGSLRREEYADILAYLLQLNGMRDGQDELPSTDELLKQVILEGPFEAKSSGR